MAREFACKSCGNIGTTSGYGMLRGSFIISTFLWIFVLPGLFYSIWRRMGRGSCRKCESTHLVRLSSKYGQIAKEEFYMKEFSKNLIFQNNRKNNSQNQPKKPIFKQL